MVFEVLTDLRHINNVVYFQEYEFIEISEMRILGKHNEILFY